MNEDQCKAEVDVPNPGGQVMATRPQYQRISIEKVTNGFIIVVGCKTFVAKSWAEAAGGLGEYFENPFEAEKKYSR